MRVQSSLTEAQIRASDQVARREELDTDPTGKNYDADHTLASRQMNDATERGTVIAADWLWPLASQEYASGQSTDTVPVAALGRLDIVANADAGQDPLGCGVNLTTPAIGAAANILRLTTAERRIDPDDLTPQFDALVLARVWSQDMVNGLLAAGDGQASRHDAIGVLTPTTAAAVRDARAMEVTK